MKRTISIFPKINLLVNADFSFWRFSNTVAHESSIKKKIIDIGVHSFEILGRCFLKASLSFVLGTTVMAGAATASEATEALPLLTQAALSELSSERDRQNSTIVRKIRPFDQQNVFYNAIWLIPDNSNLFITHASETEIDWVASEVFLLNPAGETITDAKENWEQIAQTTVADSEIPWRFSLEPYVILPFGVNGDITVQGTEAPIDAGLSDIFDVLNFAAAARFEAWKGQWGILFDGGYVDLESSESEKINTPPELQGQLPEQVRIDADASTEFAKIDLGGAYRFGNRNLPEALKTAKTEFDLGPFIFDAIVGLRFYAIDSELELEGEFGNRFEFDKSRSILEPMIGGRARWNVSENLAVLARTSVSGFGIGNLTFSIDGQAGIDWLFSGDTSLLVLYRVGYINSERGDSGIDIFDHGPVIGVKFRF
ncbi:MAG: hypothetical protein ABEI32_01895 [Halothece sp.]